MPAMTAEKQLWVVWDLEVRLPGLARLLAAGDLTYPKAMAVYEAFLPLSDDNAATAEAIILPDLPGKTYGQAQKLAVAAALTVDPESAAARREDAERSKRCRTSRPDAPWARIRVSAGRLTRRAADPASAQRPGSPAGYAARPGRAPRRRSRPRPARPPAVPRLPRPAQPGYYHRAAGAAHQTSPAAHPGRASRHPACPGPYPDWPLRPPG